jgi:cysteine desulfurase
LVRDLATLEASGGQERGYRRGTENLAGAAGMAAALESRGFAGALEHITSLRNKLEEVLVSEGAIVIAADAERSTFIGAYAMPGVASASQLVQFDLAGIAISAGSACSSGSMKPTRVLAAMGVDPEVASCTIRVSFGPETNEADVERFTAEWRAIKARATKAAA